jgi:mannose-6-phosphate isomerase-like protein (cupin superfamily)
MQKHNLRSEYWLVSEGSGIVNRWSEEMELPPVLLNKHDEYCVPVEEWHQLTNPTNKDLRVVEIQYGENCIEEDIERK